MPASVIRIATTIIGIADQPGGIAEGMFAGLIVVIGDRPPTFVLAGSPGLIKEDERY